MISKKSTGYLMGIIAAVSYGTNPLFSLPLYDMGLTPASVLFYRYFFSVLILGIILKGKGEKLGISPKILLRISVLGVMFGLSSYLLYESFLYMAAGIASTILFVYPIMVAVIMAAFFRERASLLTYICIVLALTGIGLLYKGEEGTTLSVTGMILVALSSLSYAIYIVAVGRWSHDNISSLKMTFWVITTGMSVFVVATGFMSGLQPIPSSTIAWSCVFGTVIFPTIISLFAINVAINRIGATNAAILGALEPVTALIIGIIVFQEAVTIKIIAGAILIFSAVTAVVASGKKQ